MVAKRKKSIPKTNMNKSSGSSSSDSLTKPSTYRNTNVDNDDASGTSELINMTLNGKK